MMTVKLLEEVMKNYYNLQDNENICLFIADVILATFFGKLTFSLPFQFIYYVNKFVDGQLLSNKAIN